MKITDIKFGVLDKAICHACGYEASCPARVTISEGIPDGFTNPSIFGDVFVCQYCYLNFVMGAEVAGFLAMQEEFKIQ